MYFNTFPPSDAINTASITAYERGSTVALPPMDVARLSFLLSHAAEHLGAYANPLEPAQTLQAALRAEAARLALSLTEPVVDPLAGGWVWTLEDGRL